MIDGGGKIKRFDHLDKTKDLAATRTGTAGSRDQTPTRAPAPWHAPRSGQTDLSHHCVSRQRSRVRVPSPPLPLHKAVILSEAPRRFYFRAALSRLWGPRLFLR